MADQIMMMEQRSSQAVSRPLATSSIKTILLHILDDEFHDQRIDTALSLARANSAHLSCLHVTPIAAYVAFDMFDGILAVNDALRQLDELNAKLRLKVEERLSREDVSWDYEHANGDVVFSLLRRAALADLLITAREPPHRDYLGPTIGFLGELLNESRTPLLIPSRPQDPFDPSGPAVIAWDGSVEAAHAVRAALGMLKTASEVHVVNVREERTEDRKLFPATDVLEYLSRHGIHAELTVEEPPAGRADQAVISGIIQARAEAVGASYIVIGGYSHSRFSEYMFGGVTRSLLTSCSVALVVVH